jgi:DNA (cytosine-5)-methyltransferase 1
VIALDLFAGTGWGVACQRLGIEEYGVEIMPEARAVRAANGMKTWYADVWQGLEADVRRFDAAAFFDLYSLLIASPPCQTFSLAGGGAGRRALDEVLKLIDDRAYLDPAALRAFGETHDPRTALVLTPLAYIARDVPLHVVLEQVPPVLPVWERYAEEMRAWGYSVWTGILSAEQYGVPQTRKRAILIARADGVEAAPPPPSHSRYYPRDPARLDPGVEPWVSMAEALGWAPNDSREAHALRGRGQVERYGDRPGRKADEPAFTLRANGGGNASGGFQWREGMEVQTNNFTAVARDADGSRSKRGSVPYRRPIAAPSPTVDGSAHSWQVGEFEEAEMPVSELTGRRARGSSAALWEGMRGPWGMTERPYPTVASGTEKGGGTDPLALGGSGARKILKDARERGEWVDERPATTVSGDARIWPPGHKVNADDERRLGAEARERYGDRAGTKAERVTIAEAAALQSYPPSFVWDAEVVDPRTKKLKPITKTKTFLQIGNAVPPLLAEAILRAVIS